MIKTKITILLNEDIKIILHHEQDLKILFFFLKKKEPFFTDINRGSPSSSCLAFSDSEKALSHRNFFYFFILRLGTTDEAFSGHSSPSPVSRLPFRNLQKVLLPWPHFRSSDLHPPLLLFKHLFPPLLPISLRSSSSQYLY